MDFFYLSNRFIRKEKINGSEIVIIWARDAKDWKELGRIEKKDHRDTKFYDTIIRPAYRSNLMRQMLGNIGWRGGVLLGLILPVQWQLS